MKCQICSTKLNNKTLRMNEVFNEKERVKIKKVRKNMGLCSECFIQLLFLDLV